MKDLLYHDCLFCCFDDVHVFECCFDDVHVCMVFGQSDELACQKKLRTEVIQLEDQLSQVRREYEMLRIEFEQTLAANEQTGQSPSLNPPSIPPRSWFSLHRNRRVI